MRIVRDSEKTHWAINHEITCRRCTSVFAPESRADFEEGYQSEYVYVTCPKCHVTQKVYKPWENKPRFGLNPLPCTTPTTNWHSGYESSLANQMKSAETQQEYLGK